MPMAKVDRMEMEVPQGVAALQTCERARPAVVERRGRGAEAAE